MKNRPPLTPDGTRESNARLEQEMALSQTERISQIVQNGKQNSAPTQTRVAGLVHHLWVVGTTPSAPPPTGSARKRQKHEPLWKPALRPSHSPCLFLTSATLGHWSFRSCSGFGQQAQECPVNQTTKRARARGATNSGNVASCLRRATSRTAPSTWAV